MSSKSYWLSKYALSEGVQACDGVELDTNDQTIKLAGYGWNYFKLGRDVHESESAAKKAAEDMRLKKIASLKKQIAKLEKMSFGSAS